MPQKTLTIPALAGLSIRLTDGTLVIFEDGPADAAPPDDSHEDDGGAGVREPRRPKPQPPSAAAAPVPTPADLAHAGATDGR